MSDKKYLFEDRLLPDGFRFPLSYLNLLGEELPDITPWWWLTNYKDLSISWMNILREQFPSRILVPFAKDGGSDDVACFNGADVSGNPQVLTIHSFCSPGWELRGETNSFEEWLQEIKMISNEFMAQENGSLIQKT